jgi:hypothetical protein
MFRATPTTLAQRAALLGEAAAHIAHGRARLSAIDLAEPDRAIASRQPATIRHSKERRAGVPVIDAMRDTGER